MLIHETLKKSIPDAMRARDEVRLRTLRSLVTAMTNEVVAKKRKPDEFLTDEEALAVLKRASSQRKDSIEQFEKALRNDLAEPEKAELAIIESYLPKMMGREEIMAIAKAKMAELNISSKADAAITPEGRSPGVSLEALRGKFTGALMKELRGRADGSDVKTVVDELLS
ncbi:MAG: GatB/YqeY domain-containing protein [Patescibacteria group bacterium]|nr:GatB/YqeY domain-containing protein [Patescibacteria group bacterium]